LKGYIIAFLTFEPLHIHRMTLLTSPGVFLRLYVLQSPKKPKNRTNSEADTPSSHHRSAT